MQYINIIHTNSYTIVQLNYREHIHRYLPSKSIEKNIIKTLQMYRTPKKTIDKIINELRVAWSKYENS